MAQRLGRPAGALAASATAALAVAAIVLAEPGRRWVGVAIAIALLWSCAPLLAALLTSSSAGVRRDPDGDSDAAEPSTGTVTTFVRLGDEPIEIARSSAALARRAGPAVLVTWDRDVPESLVAEVDDVVTADTVDAAIRQAAATVDTDAVLILSARAVPEMDQCRLAAGLLDDETGWVTGETRPFNRDLYASDRREVVGGALRRRAARSGLDLWENDATLIRSDLLAEHPLAQGRSWGSWLRERRSEGLRGAQVDASLSLRAAPVAAGAYWPDSLARQRASAVDVAGGIRGGAAKARCLATLLLLRELYAYPLLVWLLLPVLMGTSFAFDASPWWSAAAVALAAILRWWSLRAVLGLETTPRSDVLGAVYHAPGSLSALGAVLRGRLGTAHRAAPTRPLVWAALALTAVAGYGLLSHEPGESTSRVAVGVSLVMLAVLWAFTVRSLVERNWSRTSYRVRLRRPASVDGVEAETVDGSPGGVAVRGRFPSQRWPVGAEVQVELHLDDGSTVTSPGVVASRRRNRGADLLGLELHPGADALDGWSAQLLSVADIPEDHTPAVPLQQRTPRRRLVRALDRVVLGAVIVTSVAVVAALVLVLLGFRPMVVRSGSMVPTYHVGDIVLVDQIRADELRVGDVVTLAYYPEFGESLTHRVRSIRDVDGGVQVETRGDANESSEVWTVAPDALVGRVVASAPAIGAPATLVRTARVPLLIGLGVLAVVVAAVVAGGRTRPDPEDLDDPEHPEDGDRSERTGTTSASS